MEIGTVEDIRAALERGDESALLAIWQAAASRETWEGVLRRSQARGKTAYVQVAERALAGSPPVTALDGLEASRRLVELLTARRWIEMRGAREQGASWAQIGAALGMSKQGAQDWYTRKIGTQESHAVGPHDTDRGRAALSD